MSKHYLAKTLSGAKNSGAKWLAITALLFTGATSMVQAQVAYSVFNPLTTQTNNLDFGASTQTVLAPRAPAALLGISTAEATGALGNGWAGSASGSVFVGVSYAVRLYENRATTITTDNQLRFGSVTGGALQGVADLSTLMTHSASKTIAPTNGIVTTDGSQRFEYNFDLAVHTGLLGLNVELLGTLTVSAWSNGSQIASASVFPQLLGLTSITNSTYNNARFVFDYNPASGPLEIRWDTNLIVNAALLTLLEGGANQKDIYTISDNNFGYLTPVPEPSSLVLCAIGFGLLLRRNGRNSVARV